jgi:FkbM family methyltransferase
MKSFALKIMRIVFRVVASMMPWLPSRLEREMAYVQGKGFGEESAPFEAKIAMKMLSKFNLVCPTILDVGANIGDYSNAILRFQKNVRIFAFEPSSKANKILSERFLAKSQVTVIPVALGDKKSKGVLWSDSMGSGMASLTKRNMDHYNIKFSIKEDVDIVSLDQWVKSNGVIPDLIKIDVEGHELDVFKGGKEALRVAKIIQFEFGNSNIDTRIFFKDLYTFLMNESFEVFRISPIGIIPIKNYSESDEFFKATNYIALKN